MLHSKHTHADTADAAFAITASDGVWEVLTNERACELVSTALDADPQVRAADACKGAAKALCDAALAAAAGPTVVPE